MKLRKKDWVIVGVVVVGIAVWFMRRREGFISKSKFAELKQKTSAAGLGPDSITFAMIAPADDQFTITQADLDSVKAGTWDIKKAIDSQYTAIVDYAVEKGLDRKNADERARSFKTEIPDIYARNDGDIRNMVHNIFSKVFTIRGGSPTGSAKSRPAAGASLVLPQAMKPGTYMLQPTMS